MDAIITKTFLDEKVCYLNDKIEVMNSKVKTLDEKVEEITGGGEVPILKYLTVQVTLLLHLPQIHSTFGMR